VFFFFFFFTFFVLVVRVCKCICTCEHFQLFQKCDISVLFLILKLSLLYRVYKKKLYLFQLVMVFINYKNFSNKVSWNLQN
jgi:hypothetical protein